MFSPTFPDLQGLVRLADKTGIDIKPTLLRVLTDLYVQRPSHSPDEERHYVELASRLIELVDAGTRRIVAERLNNYRRAPRPVLERLERVKLAVMAPVPERPPQPASAGASAPTAQACPAPAQKAHPAPAQKPNPARELSDAFFAADAQERRLILLSLDYAPMPPAQAPETAQAGEAIRRLELSALARKPNAFMTTLQQFLFISCDCAARLVEDRMGESVLVAAKALGMKPEIFHRIILFLNPAVGHSVQRVHDLARLYDEIAPEAALRLLALWREAEAPASRLVAYRPVHFNDETPRARDLTTHAPRRIVRASERPGRSQRRDPG